MAWWLPGRGNILLLPTQWLVYGMVGQTGEAKASKQVAGMSVTSMDVFCRVFDGCGVLYPLGIDRQCLRLSRN